MIDKDEIARATRDADARVEELGLIGWCSAYDIELSGLLYVAEQRATRAVMLGIDKRDPSILNPDILARRVVRLSPLAAQLAPLFAATWTDAFAAGFTARGWQE